MTNQTERDVFEKETGINNDKDVNFKNGAYYCGDVKLLRTNINFEYFCKGFQSGAAYARQDERKATIEECIEDLQIEMMVIRNESKRDKSLDGLDWAIMKLRGKLSALQSKGE